MLNTTTLKSADATRLLQMDTLPVDAIARAHLPLAMVGLGLMSATHLTAPAHWASWADAIPLLHRQTPAVAGSHPPRVRRPFTSTSPHPNSTSHKRPGKPSKNKGGDHRPGHNSKKHSRRTRRQKFFAGPAQPGWHAAREGLYNTLGPASQAMLDSQTRPMSS